MLCNFQSQLTTMQNLTKDDIFHNRSNYDIIVRSETLFLVQTEIDRIWFSQEGYSSKVCLNDSFRGGIHQSNARNERWQ